MKRLNIIGCGKVGKTLARLWTECGLIEVGAILNPTLASSQRAVDFIGSGEPIVDYSQLPLAEMILIATPDAAIETCCRQLAETSIVRSGVIVFHVSGSLASTELASVKPLGGRVASVHPIKSFAEPTSAIETFPGTFCAMEGDPEAIEPLRPFIEQCGGICFSIRAESKMLYHAATVFVSNNLVALMEAGLRCFDESGVSRATALEVMRPLVTGTIENLFHLGPVHALTGPIARGEVSVVAQEIEALDRWNEPLGQLYRLLGLIALDLSTAQGNTPSEALTAMRQELERPSLNSNPKDP